MQPCHSHAINADRLQRELGSPSSCALQSEAFAMADRVVIMSRGHIAQIGKPRDIYRTPENSLLLNL